MKRRRRPRALVYRAAGNNKIVSLCGRVQMLRSRKHGGWDVYIHSKPVLNGRDFGIARRETERYLSRSAAV